MSSKRCVVPVAFAAIFALASCSGHGPCTMNCGTTGDASLSVTLAAIPFTPPPGTSILSFSVTINSVALTPSTGTSSVNIPLNASTYTVDLTRLQSDSAFLGLAKASVPTGTYNQLSVNLSAVVTYCTATSGVAGCNAGSVTQITKSFSTPTAPSFSLTLASNQQTGLRVLINFADALTVNSSTQAVTGVNLAAANVVTTMALPPTASTLSSGQLDYIEDVTGTVTAASSSSVTVATATRGSITSAITSSTILTANCVIQSSACAPKVGQVASLDAVLNANGTTTLLQYDPISSASIDLIEGVVTTLNSSSTQFQIVTNDYVAASSGSRISGLNVGDPVNVTLSSVQPFLIDSKGLPVFGTFLGNTSATNILPGQTIALGVTSFTAKSGATAASAQADIVVLRFTRVAGSVTSPSGAIFSLQSLPPFFGQTSPVEVQLSSSSPGTYLDGYANTGAINSGDSDAIRALFFGLSTAPAFTAAKVRLN